MLNPMSRKDVVEGCGRAVNYAPTIASDGLWRRLIVLSPTVPTLQGAS
jgi:hypothetical protein